MTFNFSNCRLALLVALLLSSLSLAQGPPLPDQTTVDDSQQITVYDSTLPIRERNRRITVGLLRSGLLTPSDLAGFGTTVVDARIAPWARLFNPSGIAPSVRLGSGTASTATFLRGDGQWAAPPLADPSQFDGRIASWARLFNPSGTAPSVRLGSGTASSSTFLRGDGQWFSVDGRISSWARQFNPTGIAPSARLGSGTASNATFLRGDGQWSAVPSAGLNVSEVDARIVPWARQFNPAGLIPDSFIPDTIARDLEIPILIEGTGIHIDVSGRSHTINATGTGGTSDGVLTGGNFDFNAGTLHLNRSNSLATVNVGGFPTVGTIDGRIAPFARSTNPSGTIPDTRVPMGITRDSEIVANPGGTGLTDLTTITLPDGETYMLAASGGAGTETDMVLQWSAASSSPSNFAASNATIATGLQPPANADIIALRARITGSHGGAHNDWSEWHLLDAATYRTFTVLTDRNAAPADGGSYSLDSGGPPTDQHVFPITINGVTQLGWRGTTVASASVVEMRTAQWVTVGGTGGTGTGRIPWRGLYVSGTTYEEGDFVYVLRGTERVVWMADFQTNSTPNFAPGRQWINLTDTEHFRGAAFVGAPGDSRTYFEHGDMFQYGGDTWLVHEEVSISTNEIDSATGTRFDNLTNLTAQLTLGQVDARIQTWARAGNADLVAPAKLGTSLGTGEVLFHPGGGQPQLWRTLNGTPTGSPTDGFMVVRNGSLETIAASSGQVVQRTGSGFQAASFPAARTDAEIDARIAPFARDPGSDIPTSFLPGDDLDGSPSWSQINRRFSFPKRIGNPYTVAPDGLIYSPGVLSSTPTEVAFRATDIVTVDNETYLYTGTPANISVENVPTDTRFIHLSAEGGGGGGGGSNDGVIDALRLVYAPATRQLIPSYSTTLTTAITQGLDVNFPLASESVASMVELATTAEASAGTDTARAVTPAGVTAALSDVLNLDPLGARTTILPSYNLLIDAGSGASEKTTVLNFMTDAAGTMLNVTPSGQMHFSMNGATQATPVLADRIALGDVSETGIPSRYTTLTALQSLLGAGGGGSNDGIANSLSYAFSGRTFTGTIGRTVGGDLSDTVDIPAASTTTQGLIEIATPAEASAGSDNTRAVSPAGLNQAQANKLERSDILAGTNVTITQGTGNTLTIASTGGGGGTPTGSARAELLATSSTIQTTALNEGSPLGNLWTVATGQSVTANGATLMFEYDRPDASIGVMVVARTGTTIVGEVFVPWSGTGGYFSTGLTHGVQPLRISSSSVVAVASGMNFQGTRPVTWDGAWELQLVSGGDAIPASTVVTVYEAVVRGAAGPQGPAGTGTAFDFYADVPTEIATPSAGTRFLVAPVNEAGEPNRWMGLSILKEEVGPDIFDGTTLISGDASQIQFTGDGVSLADIIGTEAVTITIPGTVSTDATITGDGSPGSPLSAVGGGGGVTYQLLSETEISDPNDITAGLASGNRLDYFLEHSRNGLVDLPSAEGVADDDEILVYNTSNSAIAVRERISDFVGRNAGEGLVAVNDGGRTRLVVSYADTGVETATPAGADYFGFTDVSQADADDQVKRTTFESLRSLVRSAGGASADFTWSDSFTTLPHGQAAIENFQGTQRFFVGINPATAPVLDEILRALVTGDHVTITQGSDTFVIRLTSGVTVHTDAATDVLRWDFAIVAGTEAFTAGQSVTISFTDHVALIPAAWAEEGSTAAVPANKLPGCSVLWASTPLPTASQPLSDSTLIDVTWTISAAAPTGTVADGDELDLPPLPPGGVTSLCVRAVIDSVEVAQVTVPWGGAGAWFASAGEYGMQNLGFSASQFLGVGSGDVSRNDERLQFKWELGLFGGGTALPADAEVRVYANY